LKGHFYFFIIKFCTSFSIYFDVWYRDEFDDTRYLKLLEVIQT